MYCTFQHMDVFLYFLPCASTNLASIFYILDSTNLPNTVIVSFSEVFIVAAHTISKSDLELVIFCVKYAEVSQ